MHSTEDEYAKKARHQESGCTEDGKSLFETVKGTCVTLVICGRAVISARVNKPYMNCKQHENIGKAMAANYYGFPVQLDLEDHLFISGQVPASWQPC